MEGLRERIGELLKSTGLTKAQFAEKCQLNPATISHIISGRNKPSLQVVIQIKKAFTNVNIDYLLMGEGGLYTNHHEGLENRIKTEASVANPSPAFPMEGVRIASVSGSPSATGTGESSGEAADADQLERSKAREASSADENNRPGEIEEGDIDRIVIFYRQGTFVAYRP